MSENLEAATCLAINIGKGLTAIAQALQENAKAADRVAEAIELLARATAGEFDAGDEERLPRSLGDRGLPDGHPSWKDGSAWGAQKVDIEPGESRSGNG